MIEKGVVSDILKSYKNIEEAMLYMNEYLVIKCVNT